MGACASKPKVLEGTAPHVAEEDIKQEGTVGDDVPNKPHALSNLFKEGKGSEQMKEETSGTTQVKSEDLQKTEETPQRVIEKTTEEVIESETDKKVDEVKSVATTPAQKEEVIKSETETTTPAKKEEAIKSETKNPSEEVIKSETEIPTEKKVEKIAETLEEEAAQEEQKIEEEKSEAPVEEKPVTKPVIEEKKSGKFWWDK